MALPNQLRAIAQSPKAKSLALKSAKTFRPVTTVAHRYGPEILTGTGIIGGLGTVILASRATLKLEEVVDRTKEAIEYAESPKAVSKARLDGILAIAKLYAPAASLGVASTAAVLGAHGVMRRRNVALVAAYKAIETSFEQYRKRVIDEYGEDKDRDFRYGFEDKTVTKDGKKVTTTHVSRDLPSQYARFFDEGNPNWSKSPEYNLTFLMGKQNFLNHMLQARGHVFLNEAYYELGMEHSQAGAVVGWLLDRGTHDNYIDFGIHDMNDTSKRNFVNGFERTILLDFNVDGVIFDKI